MTLSSVQFQKWVGLPLQSIRKYSSSYTNLSKFPDHLILEMVSHAEPVFCGKGYLEKAPRPGGHVTQATCGGTSV